jgi:hypothetical protein
MLVGRLKYAPVGMFARWIAALCILDLMGSATKPKAFSTSRSTVTRSDFSLCDHRCWSSWSADSKYLLRDFHCFLAKRWSVHLLPQPPRPWLRWPGESVLVLQLLLRWLCLPQHSEAFPLTLPRPCPRLCCPPPSALFIFY